LEDLIGPVVTCLVDDGTDFLIVFLSIVENLSDAHLQIFLQQHASPSSVLADAFPPSANLTVIVVTASSHEESAVPLKPSANIVLMRDPAVGFPLLNGLST
jgi:hypothetical protein